MLPAQKRFFIFLPAVMVVLIILFWLSAGPLLNKIKGAGNEYLANREILSQLQQKESLFKDLKTGYQEKADDLLLIDNAFIKEEDVSAFIAMLEKLAQETGNTFEVRAVESSSSKKDSEEKYPNFLVQAVLEGDFDGLLSFLASLEDSPYPPYRLLEIENIDVRSKGLGSLSAGSGSVKLETMLNIKIYSQ